MRRVKMTSLKRPLNPSEEGDIRQNRFKLETRTTFDEDNITRSKPLLLELRHGSDFTNSITAIFLCKTTKNGPISGLGSSAQIPAMSSSISDPARTKQLTWLSGTQRTAYKHGPCRICLCPKVCQTRLQTVQVLYDPTQVLPSNCVMGWYVFSRSNWACRRVPFIRMVG
jgi:hypothetical protein